MKFHVPSRRIIDPVNDQRRMDYAIDLRCLEQYLSLTRSLLQTALSASSIKLLIRQERLNCTREDFTFIHRLIDDSTITIKPADKNLGLALVDTFWYNSELTRMLRDTNTYTPFRDHVTINGKKVLCTTTSLPPLLYDELQRLMKKHTHILETWKPEMSTQILKYTKTKITRHKANIPAIYLLVKVHKPKGLCGRPIVPCTRWITTPASVLADHLLQEILRDAKIPHIVKDTKSFVNELEHSHVLCSDGVFLTGDIGSLYTNIDTPTGLRLIRQFLQEQKIITGRIEFIMDLLTFVMHHSYLSFKGKIYHQKDGTAMGTTVAPTYANIVVYMLERHLFVEFGSDLFLYRRYLDDVFAYVKRDQLERLQIRLNELHPKLIFEFSSDPNETAFLDLCIFKGERFASQRLFDLKVHQKQMNLYLYIPFHSYHTDAAKRSFIQTELMRYIRNTSGQRDYNQLKQIFYTRLRDRGYPHQFLMPIFNNIFYSDRRYFLCPSNELLNHPEIGRCPPRSTCLLKRLRRMERDHSTSTESPVFIIPYTPLSRHIPTRSILMTHWELIQRPGQEHTPIMAYQSQPSLAVRLVHQKARKIQEAEKERLILAPRTTQSTLHFPVIQQSRPTQIQPTTSLELDDGPTPMEWTSI